MVKEVKIVFSDENEGSDGTTHGGEHRLSLKRFHSECDFNLGLHPRPCGLAP